MKIKGIRNLKNSIENLLFISVLLAVGSILATLLYLAFDLFGAALFTANLWAISLVLCVMLFSSSQCCDLWIYWVKTQRRKKKNNKITLWMFVKGFCKALAYYCS